MRSSKDKKRLMRRKKEKCLN